MKTLLFCLFAILLAGVSLVVSAQNITTVKSGQYKLRHNGEIQEKTYGSQKDAISAATKLSDECSTRTGGGLCPVAIQQPELLVTTRAASSSSSSSSSVTASSSKPSSSSASSSAPAQATLSWTKPSQYVDGQTLNPENICGYSLKLGAKPEFQVKATGDKMSWIADAPKTGEVFQIATVERQADCTNYSAYVDFNQL